MRTAQTLPYGGLPDRDSLDRDLPPDRNHPDRDPMGQKSPRTETPSNREPPGQRPLPLDRQTPVKTLPSQTSVNIKE